MISIFLLDIRLIPLNNESLITERVNDEVYPPYEIYSNLIAGLLDLN